MKGKKQIKTKKIRDLTGQTFGYLTALTSTDERMGSSVVWICVCKCGKQRKVSSNRLVSGTTKSCGCSNQKKGTSMKDLTGQTFGSLTALAPTDERMCSAVIWVCVCKCGKQRKVPSNYLVRGTTTSCGCLNKSTVKDLTGQTFGNLTAISLAHERARGGVMWECECKCGTRKKILGSNLVRGSTKSCGCGQNKNRPMKNLSNQKFGQLTAISPTKERSRGSVVWKCVCSCGEQINVPSRDLLNRKTKSCGC